MPATANTNRLYDRFEAEIQIENMLRGVQEIGREDTVTGSFAQLAETDRELEQMQQADADAVYRERPNYPAAAYLYSKMSMDAGRQIQPDELFYRNADPSGGTRMGVKSGNPTYGYRTLYGDKGEYGPQPNYYGVRRARDSETIDGEDPQIVLAMMRDIARRDPRTRRDRDQRMQAAKERLATANAQIMAYGVDGFEDLPDKSKKAVLDRAYLAQGLEPPEELPDDSYWKISDVGEVVGEIAARPQEYAPFVGSVYKWANLQHTNAAVERIQAGRGTANDYERLAAFQDQVARDTVGRGVPASALKLISDSFPFLVEFATLSPAAAWKSALAAGGTKVAAAKAASLNMATIAGLHGPEFQAKYMLPQWAATIDDETKDLLVGNITDGDDAVTATVKGLAYSGIEVLTESVGGPVLNNLLRYTPLSKIANWHGWSRVRPRFVENLGKVMGTNAKVAGEYLERVGYHGVLAEWGEERIADALRAAWSDVIPKYDLGTEWADVWPDTRQHLAEFLGFGVLGTAGHFMAAGVQMADAYQKLKNERHQQAYMDGVQRVRNDAQAAEEWAEQQRDKKTVSRKAAEYKTSAERNAYRSGVEQGLSIVKIAETDPDTAAVMEQLLDGTLTPAVERDAEAAATPAEVRYDPTRTEETILRGISEQAAEAANPEIVGPPVPAELESRGPQEQGDPSGPFWLPNQGRRARVDPTETGQQARETGISEHQIIKAAAQLFKTDIRTGFVSGTAAGKYRVAEHIVRLKRQYGGDIGVMLHEVAHAVDYGTGNAVYNTAPAEVQRELEGFDYDRELVAKGQGRIYEGFAEFIRHHYTIPAKGQSIDGDYSPYQMSTTTLTPATHRWWQEFLENDPKMQQRFNLLGQLIRQFQRQSSLQQAAANIKSIGEGLDPVVEQGTLAQRLLDKTAEAAKSGYRAWFDEYLPAADVDRAFKGLGGQFREGEGLYDLVASLAQVGPTFGGQAFEQGVFGVDAANFKQLLGGEGEAVHLKDEINSLGKYSDRYYDFIAWVWARHALEVWDKEIDPGISREDAQAVYDQFKNDADFERVGNALTKFNNQLIDMLVLAGVYSEADGQAIKDSYNTFIPLFRVRDESPRGPRAGGGRRITDSRAVIKRRRGSPLPIIDPIDSTLAYASRFYTRAAHQQVINRAAQIALEGGALDLRTPENFDQPKIGQFIEVIDPQNIPTNFPLEDILGQLEELDVLSDELKWTRKGRLEQDDAPVDSLFDYWTAERDEAEIEQLMADAITGDTGLRGTKIKVIRELARQKAQSLLQFWRPNLIPPGGQPITRAYLNDKPVFIQWSPDLYRMVEAMDAPTFNAIARFFRLGTSMVRLGATVLNPTFAFTNMPRDVQTYWAQSKDQIRLRNLSDPVRATVAFIANDIARARGKPFTQNDWNIVADMWEGIGGPLSQYLAPGEKGIGKFLNEKIDSRRDRDRLRIVTQPIDSLANMIAYSEVGPRIAEFKATLEQTDKQVDGWDYTDFQNGIMPPRHVWIRALNRSNDVTTNFKLSGSATRQIGVGVVFLNASLRSSEKFMRAHIETPERVVLWYAGMIGLTAAYWMAHKDEDWYQELPPWLRYGFWTFADSDGRITQRIARPHQWGWWVPGITEAALNAGYRARGEEFIDWLNQIWQAFAPPGSVTLLTPAAESYYNWANFRDAPIVGPGTLEHRRPEDQYAPHTTWLAREVGKLFNVSPARFEHFVEGVTGGMYGNIARTFEILGHAGTEEFRWTDVPGPMRAYGVRKNYTRSVDDFYGYRQKIQQDAGSDKLHERRNDLTETENRRLRYTSQLLTELRPLIPDTRDREQRFAIEKYLTGAARFALGREELELYPNPLTDPDAPEELKQVVRRWIGLRLNRLGDPEPRPNAKDYAEKRLDWRWDAITNRDIILELVKAGLTDGEMVQMLRERGYKNLAPRMNRIRQRLRDAEALK